MRKLIFLISILAPGFVNAQGATCAEMDPICTDVGANFTANTGTTSEAGNNYGCLFTQPNPSWYYFEVATNGNIDMSLTAPSDIDFIIWGPYPNLAAAQANCGSLGPANEVDCSYSATNNETPSIPGAVIGEVYIMLITNYANIVQDITLTQTGGTGSTDCNIVNNPPCFMNYFEANISACDPATDTYSVSGQIDFDDPPNSGDLIVVDCNGNQVIVASAPFSVNGSGAGSETYTLPGSNADGLPCDVTAYFSADPSCSMNLTYTAPECTCWFSYMLISQHACDPGTGTFVVDGYVEFQSAPATGTLTFTNSCTGATDTYFAPFTSPQSYSFPGMTPSGYTNCTITAVFSDAPGCSMTSLSYDDPNNCTCAVEIGTFSEVTTGPPGQAYNMCFGESFTVTPNGDFIPHTDLGGGVGVAYVPGIAMGIWDCPPTVNPPVALTSDPCFLGVVQADIAGGWTETNVWGDCATFWYAPISMYNTNTLTYGIIYPPNPDVCYDVGPAWPLTSLAPISAVTTEDCFAGTATATITGGSAQCYGSDFDVVPGSLVPANTTFNNTSASNGGTITISGLLDGQAYSYDVTDESGCTYTVSGTFTGLQDASFTYDFKYCQDDPNPSPVITGVAGGTFSASPAGLSINPSTGVINLGASIPGIYTIQYVSPAASCYGTETFVITINPVPVIIATEDSPICDDGISTINLNETGGEATEWLWTTSGGATITFDTMQSPVVSGAVNGETFTVTGIDILTGCSNSDQVSVTVNPMENAAFTTTNFCIGSPNAATVTGTGGGSFVFNPLPGDGATINASTGEISNEVAGTTYTIEYTTPGVCSTSSTQPVTVYNLPVVITSDETICLGGSVDLTASGASTYVWSPGTWLSSTSGSTVTSTPLANIAYTVTGTDANGCQNTAISNVTVSGNAPINAGPDVSICVGANTTLTATGGVSYTWDQGLGAGNNFVVSPGVTTTYTVNGTDASGCSGSDQMTVTVNPTPNLIITDPVGVCTPNTVNITAPAVTAGSDPGTLSYWQNAGATIPLAGPSTIGTSGTYYIQLVDGNGCSSIQPVNVTINPLPNLIITDPAAVCSPSTVNITAPAVTAGSDAGTLSYWQDAGATMALAGPATVGTTGTYYIQLVDGNGCSITQAVNVVVNPLPNLIITNPAAVCSPNTVDITAPAVTAGSDAGTLSYWQDAGATVSLGAPSTVGTTGTYYIQLVDGNGCSVIQPVNVTVNPLPNLIISDPAPVCSPSTVDITAPAITAGSDAGTLSYWQDAGATIPLGVPSTIATSGTYYIQLVDGNGCSVIQAVNVVVNPTPTFTILGSNDPTLCGSTDGDITIGGLAPSTAYTLSYLDDGVPVGPIAIVTDPAGEYVITGLNAGGYSNITISDGTCSYMQGPVALSDPAAPTFTLVFTDPTTCNGNDGTITLQGLLANTNYDLSYVDDGTSVGPIVIMTNGLGEYTIIGLNAGTYTSFVADLGGCVGTNGGPIVLTDPPLPNLVTTDPAAVCSPNTVDLTTPAVTAGSDPGTLSYWQDAGASIPLAGPGSVGTTGTYYIQLVDGNSCSVIEPVNVTVNPIPNLIVTDPAAVCSPNSVDLTAPAVTAGSDAGTLSYWQDAGATIPLAGPSTVGTTGTYYIQLVNGNGCSVIQAVNATVNPLPNLLITNPAAVCSPNTVDITAPAVTAGSDPGTLSYWQDAGASIALAGPSTIGTTGTYYIQLVDGNGCSVIQPVNVTVNSLPNLIINDPADVCSPNTVDLTAPAVTAGSDAGTLSYWQNAGATVALAGPSTIGTSGTYYIQLVNGNGCSVVQPVNATINPLPNLLITDPAAECLPNTVNLTAPAVTAGSNVGALSYWQDAGATISLAGPSSVGTSGTYYIQLVDANGCSVIQPVNAILNPQPVVMAGPDQTVCDGVAVTLNGSGATSYVWNNGVTDGVSFVQAVGSVTYTVTGTDANGCTNTDQVVVIVTPLPVVFAGNDVVVCEGEQITLTGSGASSYVWDNGVTNGVAFNPVNGVYTVIGTDANGCTGTDDVLVTIELLPVPDFIVDVPPCEPFTVTLTNTTPGAVSNCIWTISNGAVLTGCGSIIYTFPNAGTYDVTLTTTTANGCTASVTYIDIIYLENSPNASFNPGTSVLSSFNTGVQFNNTSTGAVDYYWTFGDETAGTTVTNPNHIFPDDGSGTYLITLIAYSSLGCVDTAYGSVQINEELIFYVPNTFTPDDDDFNQTFRPIFSSGYDPFDYTLLIFNRWGEIVFESHNVDVGWDATYAGRYDVQDGTYTWKLIFKTLANDERVSVHGHVNVLR